MSIWLRWFGKTEQQELQDLLRQKRNTEQRGCFSDRELEEKDYELEELDGRIKAVTNPQFRLRTQARVQPIGTLNHQTMVLRRHGTHGRYA